MDLHLAEEQVKEWAIKHSYAHDEIFERMELYFRVKLLDDVIDVLADFIDAENIPEVKEMTQKRAMDIHPRAYPEYLRLYIN
ncbi:hypothetical protein [Paenibacillus sp. sgz302251]|uniref:hypothetical protein n=1 Tax=Paenibacillus sp. sgz302251 TaxID=3414493 RepID=UPI003C7BEAB1